MRRGGVVVPDDPVRTWLGNANRRDEYLAETLVAGSPHPVGVSTLQVPIRAEGVAVRATRTPRNPVERPNRRGTLDGSNKIQHAEVCSAVL